MIPHHIAAAHGMNANLRSLALANHSFAPMPQFFCIACALQNFCERFRRSTGRVFLHSMMRFHNFEVEVATEDFRGLLRQGKERIHPDTKI